MSVRARPRLANNDDVDKRLFGPEESIGDSAETNAPVLIEAYRGLVCESDYCRHRFGRLAMQSAALIWISSRSIWTSRGLIFPSS